MALFEPVTCSLEPYRAFQAYYRWYETFVGDVAVKDAVAQVKGLLADAEVVWDEV